MNLETVPRYFNGVMASAARVPAISAVATILSLLREAGAPALVVRHRARSWPRGRRLMSAAAAVLFAGSAFAEPTLPDIPPDDSKFAIWDSGPRVDSLCRALVREGLLPESYAQGAKYDLEVVKAVRAFQVRVGLKSTGIPRQETLRALAAREAGQAKGVTAPGAHAPPKPAGPGFVAGPAPAAPSLVTAAPAPSPPAAAAPSVASGVAGPAPMLGVRSVADLEAARDRYGAIVSNGGWPILPAGGKLTLGKARPIVLALRKRLAAEGYAGLDAGGAVYDEALRAALRRFQRLHGLPEGDEIDARVLAELNAPADDRLAAIDYALAKARKRAPALDAAHGRYVLANPAAGVVELVDNGAVVASRHAIFGSTDDESPDVSAQIVGVSPNPIWTVPYPIAQNDIAPKVARDKTYLEKREMRVLRHGEEADPSAIDWNREDYVLQEKPGPGNPLGVLRIDMPNSANVYMHDTNERWRLHEKKSNYVSHGCARVDDVVGFAAALLALDDPSWTRERLEALIKSYDGGWEPGEKTPLNNRIPVHWVYLTAWSTPEGVAFRPDVYERVGARG